MKKSFIEWISFLKEEVIRKENLLREPNNPLYWSKHSDLDFFKWARPAADNCYLSEQKQYNNN